MSDEPAPAGRPRKWKKFGGTFLFVSILLHVLFGVGATYLVVQSIAAKRALAFQAGPPNPSRSQKAVEHRVQVAKQKQTSSAPAPPKRVAVAGLAKVSLPEMPSVPTSTTNLAVAKLGGMGATGGLGLGPGTLGASGGGGGGGGVPNFFGVRAGAGLVGTFYDYKMDQGYQPVKGMDTKGFARVVHDVLPSGGAWHPDKPFKHYLSPAKVYGKYFMFPAIQDREAGAAFQSPRSGPGSWLAVYRGAFSSPNTGSFRFVGFGDNVMIVKLGNHVVLDASDHGYTGLRREQVGEIAFPGKDSTPLFAGEWFEMDAREAKDIEIAVGDEGGIFCSGLFIQPKGTPYAHGDRGVPKLPVFMLGSPGDSDRRLLEKAVPAECLQGPFFQNEAVRSAGDIFSR